MRKRDLTPQTIKTCYLIHKWTSLVCTVFLLLLCLTGLPLIFGEESSHWLGIAVDPPKMAGDQPRADLDLIVADATARRPGDLIQFASQDHDAPAWFVSMGVTPDAEESSGVFMYDARSGDLLHKVPFRQGIMHVMIKLHVDLFAGLPETLFLGSMGIVFAASVVSGVLLYGPSMRRLPFGTVRQVGSQRLT